MSTTAARPTARATTTGATSTRRRASARAQGGEVLVTRPVVDVAAGVDGLQFERIGKVGLKGFSELTELFAASARQV